MRPALDSLNTFDDPRVMGTRLAIGPRSVVAHRADQQGDRNIGAVERPLH